jgi:PAS domain S-box-containing protein
VIDDVKKIFADLMNGNLEPHELVEERVITKTGEERIIAWHNAILRDATGGIVATLSSGNDITERKQAEKKLAYQASLLDNVTDAIIASDEQFILTSWNRAAETLYGWKADEVLGRTAEEVLRTEFIGTDRTKVIRALVETGRFDGEVIQYHKDGEPINVDARVIALRDKNGRTIGHVTVNRDITERKKAAEQIESLARYPSENPNPVLRLSQDGIVLHANQASEALLRDWGCNVGGRAPEFWRDLVTELLTSHSSRNVDIELGEKVYSFFVTPVKEADYVNLYGRDITERKRVEDELRRSQILLQETGRMAKVGGWEFDVDTLKQRWTDEVFRIHEVDLDYEPTVEKGIDFYAPEDRAVIREAVQKAIASGEPFDLELRFITAKGNHRWVHAIGKGYRDDGRIVKVGGTFQDITEHKRMDEELRRHSEHLEELVDERTKKLQEAQRMATIGEMAAMVGHDLRNPLTGIATAIYNLKMHLGRRIDGETKETLDMVEQDIQHSDKIINDLLEYSKEIHLDLIETNAKSITKDALAHAKIPAKIRIVDSTQNRPKITVDTDKTRRVFVNLIKNAVDAMPKGGTLTIASIKSDGNLQITFRDTGEGMTEETLAKLWSPLFTTKAKGMGFGLPIAKRLVEEHGGSIAVESKPSKGSTFTVRLPMRPNPERTEA